MADITIAPETAVTVPLPRFRASWHELFLVLFVGFSVPALNCAYVVLYGAPSVRSQSMNFRYLAALLSECGSLLVLAYVLKRSRSGAKDIGLRLSGRGLLSGALLWLGAMFCSYVTYYSIQALHLGLFGSYLVGRDMKPILGGAQLAAMLPFILVNPWFEEVTVRGYGTKAVAELTGSWAFATVASVLFQTSYHLYQGWFNALCVGAAFLVFGLYFARTRNLFPIVVAHTITDVIGMIALLRR